MDDKRFAEILIEGLEKANPGFEFKTEDVLTRGKHRMGIMIVSSYGISPVVYVDQIKETMLQEQMTIPETVHLISKTFASGIRSMTANEENKEIIKIIQSGKRPPDEYLSCKLMKAEDIEENRDYYVVREAAPGLVLVLEAKGANEDDSISTALLLKSVCGGDENKMFETALRNLANESKLIAMDSIWVLTNEAEHLGAACLFGEGVADSIAKELGGDYYILPSSINDMMIVPDTGDVDEENLRETLREANRNEEVVAEKDVLTDTVYKYENGKITVV